MSAGSRMLISIPLPVFGRQIPSYGKEGLARSGLSWAGSTAACPKWEDCGWASCRESSNPLASWERRGPEWRLRAVSETQDRSLKKQGLGEVLSCCAIDPQDLFLPFFLPVPILLPLRACTPALCFAVLSLWQAMTFCRVIHLELFYLQHRQLPSLKFTCLFPPRSFQHKWCMSPVGLHWFQTMGSSAVTWAELLPGSMGTGDAGRRCTSETCWWQNCTVGYLVTPAQHLLLCCLVIIAAGGRDWTQNA